MTRRGGRDGLSSKELAQMPDGCVTMDENAEREMQRQESTSWSKVRASRADRVRGLVVVIEWKGYTVV